MDWRDELSDLALLENDLPEEVEAFINEIFDSMLNDSTWYPYRDQEEKIHRLWEEYCLCE